MQAYLAIYQINIPQSYEGGPFTISYKDDSDVSVISTNQGLALEYPTTIRQFSADGISHVMAHHTTFIPPGLYLAITIVMKFNNLWPNKGRTVLAVEISKIAAAIEISNPGLLGKKEYEGFSVSQDNTAGHVSYIEEEGPMEVNSLEMRNIDILMSEIGNSLSESKQASQENLERFGLASRWFRRGCESMNPIDKLLYWYITLEVFPAENTTRVPESVSELLNKEVYPDISPKRIKELIGIGRIAGMRADVVHSGQAFPDIGNAEFDKRLDQLKDIVYVCMRILSGRPPGNELDRWIRSDSQLD